MRPSVLILPLALLALSGCAPANTEIAQQSSPDPVQSLAMAVNATVTVDAPHEQDFTRVTADLEIAPGETYRMRMDNISATTLDLGLVGSGTRLDLLVAIMASGQESGDILYEVTLTTQADSADEPQVIATPRLLVAEGETATIHLGQDAGEIQAGFTLDLTASRVP
jgi:hypothetical protein